MHNKHLKTIRIKKSGFTLIELLVVIAVVGIMGTIIMSILFSVLRGANKTNALSKIRENGNFAMNQLTKIARSGTSIKSTFPCTGVPGQRLDVNQLDGSTTQLFCSAADGIYYNDATGKTTLVDKDMFTVKACTLTCTPDPVTGIPFVNITYTVAEKVDAESANYAEVTFTGSAQLRNTQQ
jgi:prepilin-type N-terminal cleavage/methylation domain-containing protein